MMEDLPTLADPMTTTLCCSFCRLLPLGSELPELPTDGRRSRSHGPGMAT